MVGEIVADSIFLRSLTTENAVAGRDWPITTVAGEKLSNQMKKTAALNSGRKVPGIHPQTMLQVIIFFFFFFFFHFFHKRITSSPLICHFVVIKESSGLCRFLGLGLFVIFQY